VKQDLEMKGNTLAIVLLVVGLVVGAGAGYFMAPSGDGGDGGDGGETITVIQAPLEGVNIQLGYISSTTVGLETTVPLVEEILTPDYNAYMEKLGMDTTLEFLIDDATGQAAVHLEKVQGYKSMDINVFIGGGWSSQAQAALSYCNDNDMLMWSSSSTSPLLGIADDNLYRMCPTDLIQAPAIAEMLWSHGIKAIILIQRGDAWADGIYNYLEPAYTDKGGVIIERIRYAGEATEFANYLQTAEDLAKDAVAEYGADAVGVEIISFAEFVVMMTQAEDFPTIYDLTWFGSDGTTLSQQAADDAPEQVVHLRVHSTFAAPAESEKFNDLYDRYYALVSQPFGYYSACSYDIGWVLTESILNAQSLDATVLIPIQHDTAFNNFGASGWNRLNEDGDRYGSNYQIWSYKYDGDVVISYVSGLFDGITGQVTWYTDAMGYIP
jgi:branched-chain amino acid transport system substrate-binding protein